MIGVLRQLLMVMKKPRFWQGFMACERLIESEHVNVWQVHIARQKRCFLDQFACFVKLLDVEGAAVFNCCGATSDAFQLCGGEFGVGHLSVLM